MGNYKVKNIYDPAYSANNNTIFVKFIFGAKTKCIRSYIIPTVELEPGVTVIHCGDN